MWVIAVVLLVIVRCGEGRPFSSIGLGTVRWWKSILLGLVIAVICFGVAGALIALTGYNGGEAGKALGKLPLWLIVFIVIRAGPVVGRTSSSLWRSAVSWPSSTSGAATSPPT
jgi:hypothetical protein